MNMDVLAHIMFAPVLFVVAVILIFEYKNKIKSADSFTYYGLASVFIGILYLVLLNRNRLLLLSFGQNETTTNQHLVISLFLILFGVMVVYFAAKAKNVSAILISFMILLISYLFLIHVHPEGVFHADWLSPYHKIISLVLFLISISFLIANFTKQKIFLLITAGLLFILGAQLLFYRDPYVKDKLSFCIQTGKTIDVSINNESFSNLNLIANRCDVLKIMSIQGDHIIAFGEHSQHNSYADYEESLVSENKVLEIILSESGNYLIHDHGNEEISTNLVVIK